jgi:K+-sensing histidine kinase KdpD
MKESFEYRGYAISHVGSSYIGKSEDGEDFSLVSTDVRRLMAAIDQLWDALEHGTPPLWFIEPPPLFDLDHPSVAHAFNTRSLKPWLSSQMAFVIGVLGISSSVAMLLGTVVRNDSPEILFTLAVCVTAAAFGSMPALALTLLSVLVYNVFVLPPFGSLSIPMTCEVLYFILNVSVSVTLPIIVMKVAWVRAGRERVRGPSI